MISNVDQETRNFIERKPQELPRQCEVRGGAPHFTSHFCKFILGFITSLMTLHFLKFFFHCYFAFLSLIQMPVTVVNSELRSSHEPMTLQLMICP